MARNIGTYPESSNIEGKFAGTFDARQLCPTYADLLLFTASNYIPNGFPVAVFDADVAKRGLYLCINKDALSNPASWLKISSFDASDYYTKDEIDDLFSLLKVILLDTDGTFDASTGSLDLTGNDIPENAQITYYQTISAVESTFPGTFAPVTKIVSGIDPTATSVKIIFI